MKIKQLAELLLAATMLLLTITGHAAVDHDKTIDQLIHNKQYLSAAKYISDKPELMKDDRYFQRYTNILVKYYAVTLEFAMFGLRDLKPNEDIEKVRGSAGNYEMLGVQLEHQLYNRYQENPESPYLNLAIGDYLGHQKTCGCGQPAKFTGVKGDDYPYFKAAYDAGLHDSWQLFRMGVHQQQSGNYQEAISLYQGSLKLDPHSQDALYNLALSYFQDRQDAKARIFAKKALGGYSNPGLNSDTYDLYGSILYSAGEKSAGAKNFIKALELQKWHPHAFYMLALYYREQKQPGKYTELVNNYIALDYGNSYLFNRYIEFLSENGFSPIDQKIIDKLNQKNFSNPLETGAVHFNLGKLARARGDKQKARKHFRISLAAMKKVKNPPAGAIETLQSMLADGSL
ncbi:MAG: tetratricopeptide repeat protein [Acidiferrobacterales bacterium]